MKICGNRRPEDVRAAAEADAVGAVVASPRSRRNLALAEAEQVLAAARPFQARVAVTAATDRDTLLALARMADHLQCPVGAARALPDVRAAAPHLRILVSTRPETWTEAAPVADVVLLDAVGADGYGGTGQRLDVKAARTVVDACPLPVILAGGLTPENVGDAIRAVRPYGVDVSSGVEVGGAKDVERVRAFAREARVALRAAPKGGFL